MNEIIIKKSNIRMFFAFLTLFCGGLIFTIFLVYGTADSYEWLLNFMCFSMAGMLYFFSLFYIKQIVLNKPLLIINEEGFYDYSSMFATGNRIVRWSDVENIYPSGDASGALIYVAVKDEFWERETFWIASRLGIHIMTKFSKGYDDEECFNLMNEAFNEYKKKNGLYVKKRK